MKSISLIIFIVFFSGAINAQYTKLYDFLPTAYASHPIGSLVYDGTFFYGMTGGGSINEPGTIYKIKPDGTGYLKLMDFSGTSNGQQFYGTFCSLIFDGTFLYGMSAGGGANNYGTIFKILTDGTGYVKLLDFDKTTNGNAPYGSLIFDGTFLYGMTRQGGTNNLGTIFRIKPDGTSYLKLLDFAGTLNGIMPYGSLIFDGIFLYGMTEGGGANGNGTIFKIMTDGTGYTKLKDFPGSPSGLNPYGSLIFDGTFLYGMTHHGGIYDGGTVFRVKPDGTGYLEIKNDFTTSIGNSLYGSLVFHGNFLYGMTSSGGINSSGTIFKILTDGTGYVKLFDFDATVTGGGPTGQFFSDGIFLYATNSGGPNGVGTVFKYLDNNITTIGENNEETNFAIYPNPSNGEISVQATGGGQFKIEIFNVIGKLVYQTMVNTVEQMSNRASNKNQTINLSSESNGIYFVNIKGDKGTITKKIIINK